MGVSDKEVGELWALIALFAFLVFWFVCKDM